MRDKPPFLSSAPGWARETNHVRRRWRCALASLKGVDRGGRPGLRGGQAGGPARRTVFIFISDNGQFYGEHRIAKGKVLPYQEALHLPLVIKAPRRYLNGRARRCEACSRPVANIDLAPTILSLAHAQPCPPSGPCRTMDGRSLMPLLTRIRKMAKARAAADRVQAHAPGRYATCEFAGILTRGHLVRGAFAGRRPGYGPVRAGRPGRALRPEAGSVRAPQPLLRGNPANCPSNASQAELESRLNRLRDCAGIAGATSGWTGGPYCE